jgi:RimJ/RimL family protein N-acetyltransferase
VNNIEFHFHKNGQELNRIECNFMPAEGYYLSEGLEFVGITAVDKSTSKVVGKLVLCRDKDNDIVDGEMYVDYVGLLEEYQGRGIADMMFKEILARIPSQNIHSGIAPHHKASIKLHMKNGFKLKEKRFNTSEYIREAENI